MTPYIVMLCIILFCIWGEGNATTEKAKRKYLFVALIPYFVLMAFKSRYVGTDTDSYFDSFEGMGASTWYNFLSYGEFGYVRIEKGYKTLIFLLTRITTDGQILLFTLGAFSSIALYYFINENAKNKCLALFLFMTLGFFQFAMTGIRQTFAISITLFCYKYIKEKKLYKFLLVTLIAYLFHKTAILFFPMYYVAHRELRSKEIAHSFGAMFLLFLVADKLFLAAADVLELSHYGIESTGNGYIFFLIVLFITVLLLRSRRELISLKSTNSIFINLNFISLALWTLRLVSRTAERMTLYYMPYTYVALEEYLSTRRRSARVTYTLVAIVICSYLFFKRIKDQGLDNFEFFF